MTECPPAQILRTDSQARSVAEVVARQIGERAGDRDRDRRLPVAEVDLLSTSGLMGMTVPRQYGGAQVSVATLAEVFRLLARADSSIAQIPQSHLVFLDALHRLGAAGQQAFYFGRALAGDRFANAQTERSGKDVTDDRTVLVRDAAGGYRLTGEKFYCTGSLFAQWLVVRAVLADTPGGPGGRPKALAYIPVDAAGVTVQDDWDGMGQRTTGSGTVRLVDVAVDDGQVVPMAGLFDGPTTYGARAQVLHAAIDVGLARGGLDAAVEAVRVARPWFESGVDSAAQDPLLLQQAGDLEVTTRAAEALLREAADLIDAAENDPNADTAAAASIATAVAKVSGARAALATTAALFELGGTRAASDRLNLSRYWRDARTHTLHDPVRWKVQHIGRWTLVGTQPPRHGQL